MVPDGSNMQGRALLESVAATSLIMEHSAKMPSLHLRHSNFKINKVTGFNVFPREQ